MEKTVFLVILLSGLCPTVTKATTMVQTMEPVTTQPQTTEPVATQPQTAEPVTTQTQTTEPVATQPQTTEPVATQPQTTEPVTTLPQTTTLPTTGVTVSKASVVCNETSMTVAVEKASIVGLYEDHLRLNDPSCSLSSNSSHVFRTLALNTCGTQLEEEEDNLIFRNEITSFEDSSAVITKRDEMEIEFWCVYPKKGNVSLDFLAHKIPYIFREKGFGKFTYQFEFYQSSSFNRMVDPASYPVEVELKEMVYMEITSTSSVPNTEMFVESCMATPTDNPNDPEHYSIIQNGCKKDETVQIYSSSQSQFHFAMEAFKFIGMHDQVYISCAVVLCETGNTNTRCAQGCINDTTATTPQHRQEREAALETNPHYISQGPLRVRRSADTKAADVALNLNLLFIAGSFLAAVAMVCGVVMYRSRESKDKYQP
ncbi:ZP domain-containing protein-like isoform 1-T2 [Salvelinus alpinus]|uniref:ZP domain-containing protein-like isoform X1 n=1 Tax=Salvelinus alpinus TaxID=8036 RepID=UPI0039FC1620